MSELTIADCAWLTCSSVGWLTAIDAPVEFLQGTGAVVAAIIENGGACVAASPHAHGDASDATNGPRPQMATPDTACMRDRMKHMKARSE